MSEADNVLIERGRRLEELFFFLNDPLLQNIDKYRSVSKFSTKQLNEKSLDKVVDFSIFGKSQDDIFKLMDSKIENSVFIRRKRKYDTGNMNDSKRLKLVSEISASVEETNDRVLSHPLEEVNVLVVPLHYPTVPHHVLSLAELYYLSQTLPLFKLLPGSHKTLTTESYELALLEGKIAVLYSRIEELKRQGKWSLRQPLKFADPFTTKKSHWDHLLKEGKWMSVDFREDAKFKKARCVGIAQCVKDYWDGKDVCLKLKPIVHLEDRVEPLKFQENDEDFKFTIGETEDVAMADANSELPENSQEFENLVKTETPVKTEKPQSLGINSEITSASIEIPQSINPSDIINSGPGVQLQEEIQPEEPEVFVRPIIPKIEDTTSIFKTYINIEDLDKLDQSIIRNLPKFTAFDDDDINEDQKGSKVLDPINKDVVPVSKLLYPPEEQDGFYKIMVKETKKVEKKQIPEFQKGLFGTQNHRKFNYLKPPQPPLIKNIEYRSPTIWLPRDDKLLIRYVAEYCFNWDLISEHLSSSVPSMKRYESNIERRTPWQCFERYIQLNEKFQFSDMKGSYSYNAQQWLEQAHKAQSTTKRRISPLGVGNESIQRGHRRLRWASMFDSIRKCMKKRENQLAKLNSRKFTDYTQQSLAKNDKIPSPAELSRLKYERDKSVQEAYMNQQVTRNRMMAAVAQQHKQKQLPLPQAQPPQPLSQPQPPLQTALPDTNTSNNASTNLANASTNLANNLARKNPPMPNSLNQGQISQPKPNGVPPMSSIHNQGNSRALLQQTLQNLPHDTNGRPVTPNGTPYTREQLQRLIEIQKQRKMMQYQQRQTQADATNQNNSSSSNNVVSNNVVSNNVAGTNIANTNVGTNVGSSTGPRMMGTRAKVVGSSQQVPSSNGTKPRIQFAPAQVSAIINSIQTKNPNLTKEQVTKLAASYLANLQQQQQNKRDHSANQANQMRTQPLTPQGRIQMQMNKTNETAPQLNQQTQKETSVNADLSKLDYEQRKRLLQRKQNEH